MKQTHRYIILFLFLCACTNQVHDQLKGAIKANKEAKSLVEWDSSSLNPSFLFANLRAREKDEPNIGDDVCSGLKQLGDQDLSLFDSEINNDQNSHLLRNCKVELKKRLEDYWAEQRKNLQSLDLNFTFPTKVEKRDLTNGYRAATGDVADKELILTFDDGPDPNNTMQVLDILKVVGAKVMFFEIGPHVTANPLITYRQAQEGHTIGSHTMTHRCLADTPICVKANNGTPLTTDEAEDEIRGGHQAIYDVLGFVDPFFRFPFGESDPALRDFLAGKHVAQFYWSIDSEDWKNQTDDNLLQNVLSQIDKAQKGIVLFHDIQRRTLEILPSFLKGIYDRGYTLVVLASTEENARYNSLLVTKKPDNP